MNADIPQWGILTEFFLGNMIAAWLTKVKRMIFTPKLSLREDRRSTWRSSIDKALATTSGLLRLPTPDAVGNGGQVLPPKRDRNDKMLKPY